MIMSILYFAEDKVRDAEELYMDGETQAADFSFYVAAVYAAIAQAAALERIADALEAANARDDVAESAAIYGS